MSASLQIESRYSGTSHNGLRDMDHLYTMVKPHAPNQLCHRNNTFLISERRTTSYLLTTDRTCAPKGQVAVQNSLQQRTKIKLSDINYRE